MRNADDFYNCMVAFAKNDPDGDGRTDSYGLGSNGTSAFSISVFLHMFRVANTTRKPPAQTAHDAMPTSRNRGAASRPGGSGTKSAGGAYRSPRA